MTYPPVASRLSRRFERTLCEMEFTPTIYIDESDFREKDPGAKYFGLAPGKTVRLLHAYDIKCLECAAHPLLPR